MFSTTLPLNTDSSVNELLFSSKNYDRYNYLETSILLDFIKMFSGTSGASGHLERLADENRYIAFYKSRVVLSMVYQL